MNRNTHTRQPQSVPKVNRSNPLARGLIALVDGLSGRELIAGNFASFNNGSRAVGRAGRAIEYTTSQYVTYPFANRSRLTNQLSIFSLTDYTAGGSPNGFLFGDTEAGAAGYNFGLYSNGSVWNTFVKTGGSGASASGGTFGNLQRFVHAASYDGANIRQYLNGLAAGVTAKTGNVDKGAFSLNINRWNASNVHAGRFYIGAVWNRALTPAEHASLAANPWQLFEPQAPNILLDIPSGGGVNYTLAAGGSFSLSGTAELPAVKVLTASGSFSLTGTQKLIIQQVLDAGGSVNFTGTAALSNARVTVLSAGGQVIFSGTAGLLKTVILDSGGFVQFGGSSTLIFIPAGGVITAAARNISIGLGNQNRIS